MFGLHWCQDETQALMAAISVLMCWPYLKARVLSFLAKRRHRHIECCDEHQHHKDA